MYKQGKCIDCGNQTKLISGRCQTHYWQYRAKVKTKKKEAKGESLLDLYGQIWNERARVSFLSGKRLGEFSVSYFAHVIPKGKYPVYSHRKDNIVLLTMYEHHLLDHGTIAQRQEYANKNSLSWDRLFLLRDKLLDELKQGEQLNKFY